MNDKQVSKADWDKILKLAVDIANAGEAEDEPLADEKRLAVLGVIKELLAKYGEKASLLSVKASYLDDDKESVDLLSKAYALAEAENNTYTMAEVALDLANTYWDSLNDRENAKLWNDRLGICLEHESDDSWQRDHDELRQKLE